MNVILKSAIGAAFAFALSAVSVATLAADKSSKATEWPSFKKVDTDNNGSISMDEARAVPGLADSFAQYDKNSDGQLSKSEYESAKKAAHKAASKSSSTDGSSGSSGSSSSKSTNKPAKDEVGGASGGAGSSTGSTTTK